MIIDISALVSILDQEPDAERLAHAIATASERMLAAANQRKLIPRTFLPCWKVLLRPSAASSRPIPKLRRPSAALSNVRAAILEHGRTAFANSVSSVIKPEFAPHPCKVVG